jgi:hypothetical protein
VLGEHRSVQVSCKDVGAALRGVELNVKVGAVSDLRGRQAIWVGELVPTPPILRNGTSKIERP